MATRSTNANIQQDEDEEPRFWNGMIAIAAIILLLIGGYQCPFLQC